MNFRSGSGRGRVEATLELTPLIDVIFLLLIFFVMTTTPAMSAVERLDVDLPEAASGEAGAVDDLRVVLRVFPDGEIRIQEGREGEERLVEDLRSELEKVKRSASETAIWIRGDVEASHGAVIEVLDVARSVGFAKVNMAVRPGGQ